MPTEQDIPAAKLIAVGSLVAKFGQRSLGDETQQW